MKYDLHNKFRMIIFYDQKVLSLNFKSSCLQMFFKIDILKNLEIFTGKQLCQSYFLIQLQVWRTAVVLKKTPAQVLSPEYCKIFRNTYFEEHLQMAASTLLIINLLIKYWTSADLFLIKNITWNDFYYKGLQVCSEHIFC